MQINILNRYILPNLLYASLKISLKQFSFLLFIGYQVHKVRTKYEKGSNSTLWSRPDIIQVVLKHFVKDADSYYGTEWFRLKISRILKSYFYKFLLVKMIFLAFWSLNCLQWEWLWISINCQLFYCNFNTQSRSLILSSSNPILNAVHQNRSKISKKHIQ